MPNLSCGHENPTKVMRFSIKKDDNDARSSSIGIVSLCEECWIDFLAVVEATKANPEVKYVDSSAVPERVFRVPAITEPEGE